MAKHTADHPPTDAGIVLWSVDVAGTWTQVHDPLSVAAAAAPN
jgi:hypothetical protein